MSSTDPTVSIIVPCYNSERTIRECLAPLVKQRTTVGYDIIVIDSSSDNTSKIIASEFPSVKLIRLSKRTYAGAARNAGIRETQAQFCLLVDSDCIACDDLIDRMIARHHEGDYAAVSGSLKNGTPRSLSGWTGYLLEFKEFMPTTPLRVERTVPTANVMYKRELLLKYGLFDEDMRESEDVLFNSKLSAAGERILFDPAIEATHLNRTGWKRVLFYQVDLGESSAEARKRSDIKGNLLLKYPILIFLMPLARLLRASVWLAKNDRRALAWFLMISPMYLIACGFWSAGFFKTAFIRNQS